LYRQRRNDEDNNGNGRKYLIMPRRKILRINADELSIFGELAKELHEHPIFSECDFTTIEIVAKKRNPDPIIADVEKHIRKLERFINNNGNQSVGKQKLCKIIGVSRPSLNKWIDDELISKGKTKEVYAGNQSFDLKKVLEELKIQLDRK
jgi:hypothetical protein